MALKKVAVTSGAISYCTLFYDSLSCYMLCETCYVRTEKIIISSVFRNDWLQVMFKTGIS